MTRIAVVGSGISGLAAAWLLSRHAKVTLFEAEPRLGGHTHTHDVQLQGAHYRVDTGFIVHNPAHYPVFNGFLDALGVVSQPTTMSFSVRDEASGLEYNATSLDALFCQRRNLLSPKFWAMLRDLRRFYREAPALLACDDDTRTLGQYLEQNGYGDAFTRLHLLPMASALWSSPFAGVRAFPAQYLVQFMANHQMLQVSGRPQWQVLKGGSSSYIHALQNRWDVDVRLSTPVRRILRQADGVRVATDTDDAPFDHVLLACHSDTALALLADASHAERQVLGAIGYQANDTVLHTDASVLPRHRKAWAAWNAHVPADEAQACTVSYCMNLLQSLDAPEPLIVTLNRSEAIADDKVLARMSYQHPVHTREAVAAQGKRVDIQGVQRTWFAGAYWGWGFHEDGIRSAVEAVRAMGFSSEWPSQALARKAA